MKHRLKFYWNTSIRFKLLLYFVTLILLPVITLGIIGNIIYSRFIEKETTNHTIQTIQQVNKNVEFYVNEIEKTIAYISNEPSVIGFLMLKSKNDSGRVELETEVRRVLGSFKNTNSQIAGILVVNESDLYISNEIYKVTRDSLTNDEWYKLAYTDPEAVKFIGKQAGRNLSASLNYMPDDTVSIVKGVKDPVTGRCIGVVLVDMKLDVLKKVIDDITLGKNGFIYLMDDDGSIVYAPVNPIVYRIRSSWLLEKSYDIIVKKIKDTRYQIIYSRSEYTKWRTVGVFSLNETLKQVTSLRYYALIIGIITLLLAVAAAVFYTGSITKPINKLRKLMKEAEMGTLNIRFESRYRDEIGQLGISFNNMIDQINKLINMVYDEQKNKREAELKILQAQINPHFLYNTLDTIQWMAQDHDADDIIEIVDALTSLFRIALSGGREFVTVGEELEHIKNYLIIQKVRYEDKLDYEINFHKDILEYNVLKILLQPLVENAIYHGIKEKRGGGKIVIEAKIKEDKLYFSVTDNGAGIKPQKLAQINKILDGEILPEGNRGYGVFNVNERIRLSFGMEFGLEYESTWGEGTVVRIWHPIIKRRE